MTLSDLEKLKALRNGIVVGAIATVSVAPTQAVEKQPDDQKIRTENIMPRDNTRIEPATLKLSPQDVQQAQAAQNIWKDSETKPTVIAPAEEFIRPTAKQKVVPQEAPEQKEIHERFEPLSAPELQGLDTEMRFSKPEKRKTLDDYLSEAGKDRKYEYTDFIQSYEDFHKELYKAQLDLDFDKVQERLSYEERFVLSEENNKKLENFDPHGKIIDFGKYDLEAIISAGDHTDFLNEDFMTQVGMLYWADEALALEKLAEKTERLTDLAIDGIQNLDLQRNNDKEQNALRQEIKKDIRAMTKSSSKESKKIIDILNHFNRFSEKADENEIIFDFEKDENTPASHLIVSKKDMMPIFDYLNDSYTKAIKEYPHEVVLSDINETLNHMDRHINYDLNHKISTLRGIKQENITQEKQNPANVISNNKENTVAPNQEKKVVSKKDIVLQFPHAIDMNITDEAISFFQQQVEKGVDISKEFNLFNKTLCSLEYACYNGADSQIADNALKTLLNKLTDKHSDKDIERIHSAVDKLQVASEQIYSNKSLDQRIAIAKVNYVKDNGKDGTELNRRINLLTQNINGSLFLPSRQYE